MTSTHLYPELEAWPEVKAPLVRCAAYVYGRIEQNRRFLVVPAKMLAIAGLIACRKLYVATCGDRAIVTAAKTRGQERTLSGSADRGSVLQLTLNRLPAALVNDATLVAGKGYVAIIPHAESAEFAQLPEFEKHEGMLKEENMGPLDVSVPVGKGLLWRELTTAAYGRAQRCLDVTGNIWSVAGFDADAFIRVTCYSNGVYIERVCETQANAQLRAKLARGKRAYLGKRFGRAVLAGITTDKVRVVALDGALVLVGTDFPLKNYGLSEEDRRGFDTPATAEAARSLAGSSESGVAPARRDLPMLPTPARAQPRFELKAA